MGHLYEIEGLDFSTTDLGFPANRPRKYMVGIKRDKLKFDDLIGGPTAASASDDTPSLGKPGEDIFERLGPLNGE